MRDCRKSANGARRYLRSMLYWCNRIPAFLYIGDGIPLAGKPRSPATWERDG